MTLQELYDIAGARFKLKLLAGKAGMDREISRLYYFEDLSISEVHASPCAAFILGVFWKKASPKIATASVFIGIACGVIAYILIPDDNLNYVVGNICSLVIPFVVIIIGGLINKYEFDFQKLADYKPDHKVNV